MNVSSVGGSVPSMQFDGVGSTDFRSRMEQGMAPVAELFGTSASQLMSDVRASGKSLADYAASKGVSNDKLVTAIKQSLQANAPTGAQLSDAQLTNLANRIAGHVPGDRPQVPPPGADRSGGLGQLTNSSEIKSDLDKLIEDLKSGSSSSSSDSTSVDALVQLLSRVDQQL